MQYSTQYQIRSYMLKIKKNQRTDSFTSSGPQECRGQMSLENRLVAKFFYVCTSRSSFYLYRMQSCSHHPSEQFSAPLPNTPSALFLGLQVCISTESCKLSQSRGNRFLRLRNVNFICFILSKHTVAF